MTKLDKLLLQQLEQYGVDSKTSEDSAFLIIEKIATKQWGDEPYIVNHAKADAKMRLIERMFNAFLIAKQKECKP